MNTAGRNGGIKDSSEWWNKIKVNSNPLTEGAVGNNLEPGTDGREKKIEMNMDYPFALKLKLGVLHLHLLLLGIPYN